MMRAKLTQADRHARRAAATLANGLSELIDMIHHGPVTPDNAVIVVGAKTLEYFLRQFAKSGRVTEGKEVQ